MTLCPVSSCSPQIHRRKCKNQREITSSIGYFCQLWRINLFSFSDPSTYSGLRNRIAKTSKDITNCLTLIKDSGDEFTPNSKSSSNELEFILNETDEVGDLYCYFLQAKSLQSISHQEGAHRYLQNVHGYFPVHFSYPTKLILSNSWDSSTVQDEKVFFYKVKGETFDLEQVVPLVPN